jgi:programmed cell death protein 5
MNDLEELKKRKIAEIQKQQEALNQQSNEHQQLQAQVEQLEAGVKQYLSKEALERYGNLKSAHQEMAVQLLVILGQAIQQGQIKEKISDEQLKTVLKQLQPKKKEFNIKRV